MGRRPKLKLYVPRPEPVVSDIFELRIDLADSEPDIWRQIAVPGDIRLDELHDVIQESMGWEDCHLHHFIAENKTIYGPTPPDDSMEDFAQNTQDESRAYLSDLVRKTKDRFLYEYDLGDGWMHIVDVLDVHPPEPGKKYTLCVEGARACPPEDCGGIWGYDQMLETLLDSDNEEREELLDWLGGPFDPEHFDLNEVNRRLARLTNS
ncbi:MAG: plasmid pRiA4b ORF-3 family protein [Planctomycetes bacterium]|nr:plasmid pRiA4b ORF-3 family protein [Planctomycetota bacterium]